MFERLTDRGRRVIVLAQEQARELRHNYIGTEHLVLSLAKEGDGIAAQVLAELGADRDRLLLAFAIAPGTTSPAGHIPFTPRAKKSLEMSSRESLQLGHTDIDTGHLLLGLIRDNESNGAKALVALGLDLDEVRKAVTQKLCGERPPTAGTFEVPLTEARVREIVRDEMEADEVRQAVIAALGLAR